MSEPTNTHDANEDNDTWCEIEQNTTNQLPLRYGKSAVPPFFVVVISHLNSRGTRPLNFSFPFLPHESACSIEIALITCVLFTTDSVQVIRNVKQSNHKKMYPKKTNKDMWDFWSKNSEILTKFDPIYNDFCAN